MILFLICLFAAREIKCVEPNDQDTFETIYSEALNSLKKGENLKAEKLFLQCLSIQPLMGSIYNKLAAIYLQQDDTIKMLNAYRQGSMMGDKLSQHVLKNLGISIVQNPLPRYGLSELYSNIVYPEIAKRAGVKGTVLIEVEIDDDGEIISHKLLKGIGAGCDETAIAALLNTEFTPGSIDGIYTRMTTQIPFYFELNRKKVEDDNSTVSHTKSKNKRDKVNVSTVSKAEKTLTTIPLGGWQKLENRISKIENLNNWNGKLIIDTKINSFGNVIDAQFTAGTQDTSLNEKILEKVYETKFFPAFNDGKPYDRKVKIKMNIAQTIKQVRVK